MLRKSTIASMILFAVLVYIISPWFFEKKLLFNELLSLTGFGLLAYHQFRIGRDPITISVLLLMGWGIVQLIVSLFTMDNVYYLLRNSVIVYSMAGFFVGYYFLKYIPQFISRIRTLLRIYILVFLALPVSKFFFERFGMAVLFPALFRKAGKWTLPSLIILSIIYGVQYSSATAILVACFFTTLLLVKSFKLFIGLSLTVTLLFTVFFYSVQPNLGIIKLHYSPYSDFAIHEVMNSHKILNIDGNSTWRLVLWKQVIVDQFPRNLLGIGFGTPMFSYFPVEDAAKIKSLPYVLGAHNSFIYLFGRLGLIYVLLTAVIYFNILKEYFKYKNYYYSTSGILIFWSFFAYSIVALVNPALESPIYAVGYWIVLGLTAKFIYNRKHLSKNPTTFENSIRP